MVIEFQNSPINKDELEQRERFYEKMIWVVNTENISIEIFLVESILDEIKTLENNIFSRWLNPCIKVPHNIKEKLYEYRNHTFHNMNQDFIETIKNLMKHFELETDNIAIQIPSDDKPNPNCIDLKTVRDIFFKPVFDNAKNYIEKLIKENESQDEANKNYKYKWKQKRKVWSYAKLPVFLDTGKELLWIKSDSILRKVPIDKFLSKYCND